MTAHNLQRFWGLGQTRHHVRWWQTKAMIAPPIVTLRRRAQHLPSFPSARAAASLTNASLHGFTKAEHGLNKRSVSSNDSSASPYDAKKPNETSAPSPPSPLHAYSLNPSTWPSSSWVSGEQSGRLLRASAKPRDLSRTPMSDPRHR